MNLSPYQVAVAAFVNEFYTKARKKQVVNQLEEFKWFGWLAGRGFGKTWALNCNVVLMALLHKIDIAIIAPTNSALVDITLDGSSGLKSIIPTDCLQGKSWDNALHQAKMRVTLGNGSRIFLRSAEKPDRIRGLNLHACAFEEMAAFKNLAYIIAMAEMAVRLGDKPKFYFATTPRPIPALKDIVSNQNNKIVRGSTSENHANLSPSFYDDMVEKYGGTRLGRQELEAEMLSDIEGALWTGKMIDDCHMAVDDKLPVMKRVIVGVDPSGKGNEAGDFQGIVVCGLGEDGIYYVIDDVTCSLSPEGWANQAVHAYYKHNADRIVAESNFGGDMVKSVIRNVDDKVPYTAVTASRGKHIRAEPVATLYEQGKVKHIRGLGALESQMLEMSNMGFKGKGSPDRLDALVWAMTELMPSNKYIAYGGSNK